MDPDLARFATHHHGVWRRTGASVQHHGVVLVDVGCTLAAAPAVEEEEGADRITVALPGLRVRFERGQLPALARP